MYIPLKRFTQIAEAFYLAQRNVSTIVQKKIDIAAEEALPL